MVRYLLPTASVHTTAAACDYLQDRLGDDDSVVALAVTELDADPRDGLEALNVARVRLAGAAVETEQREGDAAESTLAAANDHDVDEIVIGARSGEPEANANVGTTARTVIAAAEIPVVVVPLPDLD